MAKIPDDVPVQTPPTISLRISLDIQALRFISRDDEGEFPREWADFKEPRTITLAITAENAEIIAQIKEAEVANKEQVKEREECKTTI